jgi:hypothetical protein
VTPVSMEFRNVAFGYLFRFIAMNVKFEVVRRFSRNMAATTRIATLWKWPTFLSHLAAINIRGRR